MATSPTCAAVGGDLVGARTLLTRAIELYGGPPLGSASEELGLADVTAHFEERRGEAVEARTEVRLRLGEHAELPAALASEIARKPYRERLRLLHRVVRPSYDRLVTTAFGTSGAHVAHVSQPH